MSNATKSRKSVKPGRSIRLVITLDEQGKNGLVFIQCGKDGKDSANYLIERRPSDFGTAYRLDKVGTAECYDVLLEEGKDSCTCPGHTYHGHCKHVDGLKALRQAGKL